MSDLRVIVGEPLEAGRTYTVSVPKDISQANVEELADRLAEMARDVGCRFLCLKGGWSIEDEGMPTWASSTR